MMKSSRVQYKRKGNWRKEASLLLLELVTANRRIVEGKKFNQHVTARQRAEVWENITTQINAAFPEVMRDVTEVEKKWWTLKAQGREEIHQYRKAVRGTGGGPPPKEISEVALAVENILGVENQSISGVSDDLDANRPTVDPTKLGRRLPSGSTIAVGWNIINRSSMNTNFSDFVQESSKLPFEKAYYAIGSNYKKIK